jgi:hypothetical protein
MKRWMIGMTVIGAVAGISGVSRAQDSQPLRVESTQAPVRAGGVLAVAGGAAKGTGKTEKVTYLGTVTSPASASMREQLKLPKGAGLVVDSVEAKSPAELAGVKQHDVIEKLNDQLLVNTDQFNALLRSMKSGDEVTLAIVRQGERQSLKAKLAEHEGKVGVADGMLMPPPTGAGNVMMAGGADGRPMLFTYQGVPPAPRAPGQPMTLTGNVIVQDWIGKQNTEWSDGQVRIGLEREGDKTTKVTIKDVKTGETLLDGAPPAEGDPFWKAQPQLVEKLKKAEEAAKPIRILAGGDLGNGLLLAGTGVRGFGQVAGGRGKVMLWKDDNHILMMRMMGAKPLYLLALSKKDGRTLYDGPVMTDEQRQSVPTEVSESFEMVAAHPEQAKEFGVEAKK